MATALQQQLAAIAANSTHQLDLKVQKARHSKSLLFAPRDAASQSFDTIYQICYEGFEELCMLDARFSTFRRNLFSWQSKTEDRTQMTAAENGDLDQTIEGFLGLVGGRLLLKPAMKAVEWLVRRFRVQEYNTQTVLLTFLPYHTSDIFPSLMSILPDRLPPSFKYLHPYVTSLQCPPRHAILSAAISNPNFFSAFSKYALAVTRVKHQSPVLLAFWASITAQAVNGMIDASRSGRESVRKQREEDILLRVLPVLQSALSIKGVTEIHLGSCMIITILATKASLDDKVLNAMMEAVVGSWTQPIFEDSLTCLAVLADEKQRLTQPKSVTTAILKFEKSTKVLDRLSKQQRVDKLVLATCLGAIDDSNTPTTVVRFITSIIEYAVLSERGIELLVEALIEKAKSLCAPTDGNNDDEDNAAKSLRTVLAYMCNRDEIAKVVQNASRDFSFNLFTVPLRFAAMQEGSSDGQALISQGPNQFSGEEDDGRKNLEIRFNTLPDMDSKHLSFLDPFNDECFDDYLSMFEEMQASAKGLQQYLNVNALQRKELTQQAPLLSLLARAWTTSTSAIARSRALDTACSELQQCVSDHSVNLQALIPYVIVALGDPVQRVRQAAAAFCVPFTKTSFSRDAAAWCANNLYGPDVLQPERLSTSDALKFWNAAILSNLENFVLDSEHVVRAIANALNATQSQPSKTAVSEEKHLKIKLRSSICTFLASHLVATPVLNAKLRLLSIIHDVGKAANEARRGPLLWFVKDWVSAPSDEIEVATTAQHISAWNVDRAIVGILSHRSVDELQTLKGIASGSLGPRLELSAIAFKRLRKLWSAMTFPSQVALVDFLFDLVLGNLKYNVPDPIQADALDSLRSLDLPTEVVVHLLESLPNAADIQEQQPPGKKQRTSRSGDFAPKKAVNQGRLNNAIRKITMVLELIEAAKPERRPEILRGLFHLLGELHHYKTMTGSQLVYLQGSLVGCLLSVVNGLNASMSTDVDRSVIRADLIVECVRTTSSTQVHNTALLLMSSLASWAPELVLHSVMPLFTFISSTLLKQSDEFSVHVTDQTVARIVPPLAASLKRRGRDVVTGASELLLSFIAAFEHIPLHRRAGLFRHLVQTLGSEESLFAVVAMLVERYSDDSQTLAFVSELMNTFSGVVQLQAASKYLDLVFDGLMPKRRLADVILGFGDKDAKQIERSIATLLGSLAQLLRAEKVRKRVSQDLGKDEEQAGIIRSIYARLLDQSMQLTRDSAGNEEVIPATSALLESVLLLMPTKDFIESSAQLMRSGSDETRQQVFRSLEARVAQAKKGDDLAIQQTFIDVLPECCAFLREDLPISIRHAAITCIDQIVEKYGKRDKAAVAKVISYIIGDGALNSDDTSLHTISILCLASIVEILEDEFVSSLPKVLSTVLNYLEGTIDQLSLNRRLQSAGFAFASAVLDHLPWLLSARYLDRALVLSAKAVSSDSADQNVTDAASQFCFLAAQRIEAQEFFLSVDKTWSVVIAFPKASRLYLHAVQQAILHHSKSTITKCSQLLFNVTLQAFDLRRALDSGNGEDGDSTSVIGMTNEVALEMTLKLNDATFRPFFIRLVEWTVNELPRNETRGSTLRAISLFSFAFILFEELKSIVTSYTSFLLESAADLLSKPIDSLNPIDPVLLDLVVQTLSSSFRHDQDDFWQTPAHFDVIAPPLLGQLQNAKSYDVNDHVIPALCDLAAAAASPEHHKAMNAQIMSYLRHQDPAVRLAAVQCEQAITDRAQFDWLALLPEMLPFISELQEDEDETVERETLRWVAQIENVTGESLDGMLH